MAISTDYSLMYLKLATNKKGYMSQTKKVAQSVYLIPKTSQFKFNQNKRYTD